MHISLLIQSRRLFYWRKQYNGKKPCVQLKCLNGGFVSFSFFFTCQLMDWIIVMFLSAVWTLILTAPIHCRASIDEQVMQCYISPKMKNQTHLHLGVTFSAHNHFGWTIHLNLAFNLHYVTGPDFTFNSSVSRPFFPIIELYRPFLELCISATFVTAQHMQGNVSKQTSWNKSPAVVKQIPRQRQRLTKVENLKASEVHGGFDEDGVVTYVWVLALQLGQRTEERAAAGDVHLAYRPLEWGGSDVGTEGVDDVLSVTLVQQHQRHLEESN